MSWGRLGAALLLAALLLLPACASESEPDDDPAPPPQRQVTDRPFAQTSATPFLRADVEGFFSPTPQHPNHVFALAEVDGTVFAGAIGGLWTYDGAAWILTLADVPVFSLLAGDAKLWLGSERAVLAVDGSVIERHDLPVAARVTGLAHLDGTLYAGCEQGLFVEDGLGFAPIAPLAGRYVTDLLATTDGLLWVATLRDLYAWDGAAIVEHVTLADRLLSRRVLALGAGTSGLWIGTDNGLNRLDDEMSGFLGAQGLPVLDVTAVTEATTGPMAGVWLGFGRGAAWWREGRWDYFAGRRWLPSDSVQDVLAVGNEVWIATDNGVAQLRADPTTLEEKAAYYHDLTAARHDRGGLVAACDLDIPGDLSTFRPTPSTGDGLATGLHLAALSFRYAVTDEAEVRDSAARHFAAMAFLETVTPIDGLPARSIDELYSHSNNSDCAPLCDWQANAELGYDWLSDTDAQEMLGHFFAYAVYFDLAASDGQKVLIAQQTDRLARHLLNHDFHLIDWDGKPTTWGNWNPDDLWRWFRAPDPFAALRNYGQVLPNSLQILMFMKAAHHITGEARYAAAYDALIAEHALDDLVVNAAVKLPIFTNHNTDLLLFLTFYPLLQYETDEALLTKYRQSLDRAFAVNRVEQNSLFNFIYGALTDPDTDFGVAAAAQTLRRMPLNLVDWRMENSERVDVTIDPLPNRAGLPVSATNLPPLPPDQRALAPWNNDPFVLDAGGEGTSEISGSFWLLAYWLGRFHAMIVPQ
jgi:hypothetical protein